MLKNIFHEKIFSGQKSLFSLLSVLSQVGSLGAGGLSGSLFTFFDLKHSKNSQNPIMTPFFLCLCVRECFELRKTQFGALLKNFDFFFSHKSFFKANTGSSNERKINFSTPKTQKYNKSFYTLLKLPNSHHISKN